MYMQHTSHPPACDSVMVFCEATYTAVHAWTKLSWSPLKEMLPSEPTLTRTPPKLYELLTTTGEPHGRPAYGSTHPKFSCPMSAPACLTFHATLLPVPGFRLTEYAGASLSWYVNVRGGRLDVPSEPTCVTLASSDWPVRALCRYERLYRAARFVALPTFA